VSAKSLGNREYCGSAKATLAITVRIEFGIMVTAANFPRAAPLTQKAGLRPLFVFS
jgi:hypothetical protein